MSITPNIQNWLLDINIFYVFFLYKSKKSMNKKELKKAISQQLNVLNEQVEKIRNTGIDSEEENNWDSDYYSELQTNLEITLALLKDEIVPNKLDDYGDPIILKKSILTLLTDEKKKRKRWWLISQLKGRISRKFYLTKSCLSFILFFSFFKVEVIFSKFIFYLFITFKIKTDNRFR